MPLPLQKMQFLLPPADDVEDDLQDVFRRRYSTETPTLAPTVPGDNEQLVAAGMNPPMPYDLRTRKPLNYRE